MKTEQRYTYETRCRTWRKRFEIWLRGLHIAFLSFPEKLYLEGVVVRPGDPGYEDAPFELGICENSMVFKR